MRLAVVSPFLDRQHGTELCIIEQIERLARRDHWSIELYAQKVSQPCGVRPAVRNIAERTWDHPLASSFRYHRASDAAPEGSVGLFVLCPYCDTPPPLRLWMGMGLCFGMVEQSQADKLAMPLLRSAALLLRRRLSASSRSSATLVTRDHAYLSQVARAHPREFIVMVIDGASSHVAKDLVVPENIRLLRLPAYAPELIPARTRAR